MLAAFSKLRLLFKCMSLEKVRLLIKCCLHTRLYGITPKSTLKACCGFPINKQTITATTFTPESETFHSGSPQCSPRGSEKCKTPTLFFGGAITTIKNGAGAARTFARRVAVHLLARIEREDRSVQVVELRDASSTSRLRRRDTSTFSEILRRLLLFRR